MYRDGPAAAMAIDIQTNFKRYGKELCRHSDVVRLHARTMILGSFRADMIELLRDVFLSLKYLSEGAMTAEIKQSVNMVRAALP